MGNILYNLSYLFGKYKRYVSEPTLFRTRNGLINFSISFPNIAFSLKFLVNNITSYSFLNF